MTSDQGIPTIKIDPNKRKDVVVEPIKGIDKVSGAPANVHDQNMRAQTALVNSKRMGKNWAGFDPSKHIPDYYAANRQSGWDVLGNAIVHGGAELVFGTLESAGYLTLGIADIWDAHASNKEDLSNWFSEWAAARKQQIMDYTPIHHTRESGKVFNPLNARWWAGHAGSLATFASMFMGVGLVKGGAKLLTKGLIKAASKAEKVQRLQRLARSSQALQKAAGTAGDVARKTGLRSGIVKEGMNNMGHALMSRSVENLLEANATRREMLGMGYSEDEANYAASEVVRNGDALLLVDMLQWGVYFRGGWKKALNKRYSRRGGRSMDPTGKNQKKGIAATLGDYTKEWGMQAPMESFEEAWQEIGAKEAELVGKGEKDPGGLFFADGFMNRWTDYIHDQEVWTGALLGAAGAGLMKPSFGAVEHLMNAASKNKPVNPATQRQMLFSEFQDNFSKSEKDYKEDQDFFTVAYRYASNGNYLDLHDLIEAEKTAAAEKNDTEKLERAKAWESRLDNFEEAYNSVMDNSDFSRIPHGEWSALKETGKSPESVLILHEMANRMQRKSASNLIKAHEEEHSDYFSKLDDLNTTPDGIKSEDSALHRSWYDYQMSLTTLSNLKSDLKEAEDDVQKKAIEQDIKDAEQVVKEMDKVYKQEVSAYKERNPEAEDVDPAMFATDEKDDKWFMNNSRSYVHAKIQMLMSKRELKKTSRFEGRKEILESYERQSAKQIEKQEEMFGIYLGEGMEISNKSGKWMIKSDGKGKYKLERPEGSMLFEDAFKDPMTPEEIKDWKDNQKVQPARMLAIANKLMQKGEADLDVNEKQIYAEKKAELDNMRKKDVDDNDGNGYRLMEIAKLMGSNDYRVSDNTEYIQNKKAELKKTIADKYDGNIKQLDVKIEELLKEITEKKKAGQDFTELRQTMFDLVQTRESLKQQRSKELLNFEMGSAQTAAQYGKNIIGESKTEEKKPGGTSGGKEGGKKGGKKKGGKKKKGSRDEDTKTGKGTKKTPEMQLKYDPAKGDVTQQQLESQIAPIRAQIEAIEKKKKPTQKEKQSLPMLKNLLATAMEWAQRGVNTTKITLTDADGNTQPENLPGQIEQVIQNLIKKGESPDRVADVIGKMTDISEYEETLRRYLRDRFTPGAPQVQNNKAPFNDWVQGIQNDPFADGTKQEEEKPVNTDAAKKGINLGFGTVLTRTLKMLWQTVKTFEHRRFTRTGADLLDQKADNRYSAWLNQHRVTNSSKFAGLRIVRISDGKNAPTQMGYNVMNNAKAGWMKSTDLVAVVVNSEGKPVDFYGNPIKWEEVKTKGLRQNLADINAFKDRKGGYRFMDSNLTKEATDEDVANQKKEFTEARKNLLDAVNNNEEVYLPIEGKIPGTLMLSEEKPVIDILRKVNGKVQDVDIVVIDETGTLVVDGFTRSFPVGAVVVHDKASGNAYLVQNKMLEEPEIDTIMALLMYVESNTAVQIDGVNHNAMKLIGTFLNTTGSTGAISKTVRRDADGVYITVRGMMNTSSVEINLRDFLGDPKKVVLLRQFIASRRFNFSKYKMEDSDNYVYPVYDRKSGQFTGKNFSTYRDMMLDSDIAPLTSKAMPYPGNDQVSGETRSEVEGNVEQFTGTQLLTDLTNMSVGSVPQKNKRSRRPSSRRKKSGRKPGQRQNTGWGKLESEEAGIKIEMNKTLEDRIVPTGNNKKGFIMMENGMMAVTLRRTPKSRKHITFVLTNSGWKPYNDIYANTEGEGFYLDFTGESSWTTAEVDAAQAMLNKQVQIKASANKARNVDPNSLRLKKTSAWVLKDNPDLLINGSPVSIADHIPVTRLEGNPEEFMYDLFGKVKVVDVGGKKVEVNDNDITSQELADIKDENKDTMELEKKVAQMLVDLNLDENSLPPNAKEAYDHTMDTRMAYGSIEAMANRILDNENPLGFRMTEETGKPYTKEDFDRLDQWFEENLPQFPRKLRYAMRRRGHDGTLLHGMFTRSGEILVDAIAEQGTGYHEAYHAVSLALLTEGQRFRLYNEWSRKNVGRNVRVYRGGKWQEVDSGSLTWREVEEQLAEMFREYMLTGTLPQGYEAASNWFTKLMQWLTQWLGYPNIRQVFEGIAGGEYANVEPKKGGWPDMHRETAVALARGKKFHNEIMQGVHGSFMTAVNRRNLTNDVVMGNVEMEDLRDVYKEVHDGIDNTINAVESFIKKHYLGNPLIQQYINEESDVTPATAELATHQRVVKYLALKERLDDLVWARDNFYSSDTGYSVIDAHFDKLKTYGIEIDADNVDEMSALADPDNDWAKIRLHTSNKASTSNVLRFHLSAVRKRKVVDRDGNVLQSDKTSHGFDRLAQFGEIFQLLAARLANTTDVYDIMDKLRDVHDIYASKYYLEDIFRPFGFNYNGVTGEIDLDPDMDMIAFDNMISFVDAFAKAEISFRKNIRYESENGYRNVEVNNTNLNSEIYSDWVEGYTTAGTLDDFEEVSRMLDEEESTKRKVLNKNDHFDLLLDALDDLGFNTDGLEQYTEDNTARSEIFLAAKGFLKQIKENPDNPPWKQDVDGSAPVNDMKTLIRYKTVNMNSYNEAKISTLDGQSMYPINQHTFVTMLVQNITSRIDEVKNDEDRDPNVDVYDLVMEVLEDVAPHLVQPYSSNSKVLRTLIEGQGAKLSFHIQQGNTNEDNTLRSAAGNMSNEERLMQEIIDLANGQYHFMRASDNEIERTWGLQDNRGNFTHLFSIGNLLGKDRRKNFGNAIADYIEDEIRSIHDVYNDETKQNLKAYGMRLNTRDLKELVKNNIALSALDPSGEEMLQIQAILESNDFEALVEEFIDNIRNGAKADTIEGKIIDAVFKDIQEKAVKIRDVMQHFKMFDTRFISQKNLDVHNNSSIKDNMHIPMWLAVNNWMAVQEQFKLFFGHPAHYATTSNVIKRIKLGHSPKHMSMNDAFTREYIRLKHGLKGDSAINVGVVQDIVVSALESEEVTASGQVFNAHEKYLQVRFGKEMGSAKANLGGRIESTDGHGVMALDAFKELGIRNRNWDHKREAAYQWQKVIEKTGKIPEKITISKTNGYPQIAGKTFTAADMNRNGYYLTQQKPVAYGSLEDTGSMQMYKFALSPMLPEMILENPVLRSMHDKMVANGLDMLVFESAAKINGTVDTTTNSLPSLIGEGGEIDNDVTIPAERMPWQFMGISVENAPVRKPKANDGKQKVPLEFGDDFDNGVPADFIAERAPEGFVDARDKTSKARPEYDTLREKTKNMRADLEGGKFDSKTKVKVMRLSKDGSYVERQVLLTTVMREASKETEKVDALRNCLGGFANPAR